MANQIIYIIRAIDQATAPMRKVGTAAMAMTRNVTRAGAAMKKMGYHFTSLRGIISAHYGKMLLAFPISKAAEFEDKMIDIQRVTDFKSPDAFAKLREDLLKMSVHLGLMPAQMGAMGYEIAKFINDPKLLKGYTELAAKVSKSFDIPGKEAGEQIGKISDKMGLNLQGMEGFLDAVNYAADRSATSVKNQLQIIARVSTNLKGMKLPPNLAAGWANFADRIKATPRTAAKGLEMFMREIGKMRGGYRKLLKPGADTNAILITFLEKLKKMPEITRKIRLDRVFPTRVADFVNKMVDRLDVLKNSLSLVTSEAAKGSMGRELAKKLASAKHAMEALRAIFEVVAIQVGDAFLPMIKELGPQIVNIAWGFREFVKNHPMLTKIVMGVIALVTALTFATIVIGLVAVGVGTLMSPITLIVIGVMAIVAAFTYLYMKSEGVRKSFAFLLGPLKQIWSQLSNIFSMLFPSVNGSDVLGGVFGFLEGSAIAILDALGIALNLLTLPFRTVFGLLEGIISLFVNFGTYVDKFSGFLGQIFGNIGAGTTGLGNSLGGNEGSVSAQNAAVNTTNINGQIEVAASKGSEIRKTQFNSESSGNTGFNMGITGM